MSGIVDVGEIEGQKRGPPLRREVQPGEKLLNQRFVRDRVVVRLPVGGSHSADLRLAAGQGDVKAQFNLGTIYDEGKEGVEQDDKEALKWYRLAAEQGDVEAQFNVGQMFRRGRGILKPDFQEAIRWYRRAAEQGHEESQVNLGGLYFIGKGGIPRDEVHAYKWTALAAAQGNEEASKTLKFFEQKMRRDNVIEGQRLAKEWLNDRAKSPVPGDNDPTVQDRRNQQKFY